MTHYSDNKAGERKIYTTRGALTAYGMARGLVEFRGTHAVNAESYVTLERAPSIYRVYRVSGGGRWIRGENTSYHTSLTEARKAFKAFDHVGLSARLRDEHFTRINAELTHVTL
jgi:hypothetical protein